jgi:hypothetical protein
MRTPTANSNAMSSGMKTDWFGATTACQVSRTNGRYDPSAKAE